MPSAEDNAGFSSQERLKSSLSILSTVKEGASVNSYPIKCFYRRVTRGEVAVQLAVVVSKRRFKHAVDRNRVKRLMREAYRLQKQGFDLVTDSTLQMCWLFVGRELPTFEQVRKAVGHLARKMSEHQEQPDK